jgi:hypothetical protein
LVAALGLSENTLKFCSIGLWVSIGFVAIARLAGGICERGSVTRPTDLPSDRAKRLAELECPDFETRPWVTDPALSIPPAVALGVLVRGGAPTDRAGTAFAAGLSSAAWGAFVFVFACPSDDPTT